MTEKTVRDVPRPGFIQYLAIHMYRNHIIDCPVMSHNPANAKRFENFKKWWFLEGSKLITQWYEAPSLPPPVVHAKKDMTKQEKDAYFKNHSIVILIRQFVDLGWVKQDKTGIMIVTELGKEKLDEAASAFKNMKKTESAEPEEE